MSRSTHTRPGWLSEYREGRLVHDHRRGLCRPETLDDLRASAGGADLYRRAPRHDCPRRTAATPAGGAAVPCSVCDAVPPAPTCTWEVNRPYSYVHALYGGSDTTVDRRHAEGSARAQTRDTLRAAARDYNTRRHTDLEPAPTRHRHCCAAW